MSAWELDELQELGPLFRGDDTEWGDDSDEDDSKIGSTPSLDQLALQFHAQGVGEAVDVSIVSRHLYDVVNHLVRKVVAL